MSVSAQFRSAVTRRYQAGNPVGVHQQNSFKQCSRLPLPSPALQTVSGRTLTTDKRCDVKYYSYNTVVTQSKPHLIKYMVHFGHFAPGPQHPLIIYDHGQ